MVMWEQFPSCCGIACIYGMGHEDLTAARLNETENNAMRERKGYALCTVAEIQEPHAFPILQKAGYSIITRFINPNTQNYVSLWMKELPNVAKQAKIREQANARHAEVVAQGGGCWNGPNCPICYRSKQR